MDASVFSNIVLWAGVFLTLVVGGGIVYIVIKRRSNKEYQVPIDTDANLYRDWGAPKDEALVERSTTFNPEEIKRSRRQFDVPPPQEGFTIQETVVAVIQALRKEDERREFYANPDLNDYLEKKILRDIFAEASKIEYDFTKEVEVLGTVVNVKISSSKEIEEEQEPQSIDAELDGLDIARIPEVVKTIERRSVREEADTLTMLDEDHFLPELEEEPEEEEPEVPEEPEEPEEEEEEIYVLKG